MRIRALTATGDWTYGKGQNDYNTGQAAAAELIQSRLLSFLGDCFFDTGAGIDWFGYLGGKDELSLNLAVSATILNTPDQNGNQIVTGLQQVSVVLNRATRNLAIQYQAITVFSVVTGAFTYDLGGSS